MASPKCRRPPPRDAANGLLDRRLLASFDGSENIPRALLDQVKIVAAFIAAIDPAVLALVVALAMGVAS